MKKIAHPLSLLAAVLLGLLTACEKKDELNTGLSPVNNLFAPANNAFVKLQPSTNAAVTFEWDQARAADGTLVLYEVAFDRESGDFSKPVYATTADNGGVINRLTLSHKDLNKIANLGGIKSLEQGKLKWTVVASKGVNALKAADARVIEVERPAGFAEIPADLYLTGEATEAGTDAAKATKFRQVASGVFELYTSLKGGSYKLVDRNTGTAKSYYFEGQTLREGEAGASPATDPKVYRITLDFNSAAASLTEIVSVGLWISAQNKVTNELAYRGNGTWMAENIPIEFFQFSWGRDERYKFRLTVKDGAGQTKEEYFGSVNADNQRPTAATPAAFYHVVPVSDSQWDFTFKFASEVDRSNADVVLTFQSTAPYTHEVRVR